jgi:AGCS family alanine or glycine:cation symporter
MEDPLQTKIVESPPLFLKSLADQIFDTLAFWDNFYWSYIGWTLIVAVGLYLTVISKGLQFRAIYNIRQSLKEIFHAAGDKTKDGINPFKLYFASVGGMVGLGNIVGISVALMIGGPGSLFWTVIASVFGMLLKYSEIYLGVKHRVRNTQGGFDGGPMYYLQAAFKTKTFAYLATILICIFGIETFQFLVLVDRIEHTFDINRVAVMGILLSLVLYTTMGGINRLANVCTVLMPVFMIIYIVCTSYIIIVNANHLPEFLHLVITTAFTGHAAIGGFAGSTMLLGIYLGMSRTVYSGDIGIGYDSIVQSETRIANPKQQATLAIYALFTDTAICLLTNLTLGVSGAWYTLNHLNPSDVVANVLSQYFPYSDLFMTILMFFAGFTTIIAYLAAGTKCALFLYPKNGKRIYLTLSVVSFIFFCSFSQEKLMIFMSIISGLLVLINLIGIFRLRKEIEF